MTPPTSDVAFGKLCLYVPETVGNDWQGRCREMSPEVATAVTDERTDMSVIDAALRRIETARAAGAHRTAEAYTDDLIDYVWGPLPHGAA